ncbi:lipopolysaccharide biosynthesis protein [Qipengyuania sphaerica]|uniref:lipopolysaccharide biosynthesis protein n=1 Tax=Qipengyuania sphaerica TaxID=2867243 RepID=UPI001C8748A6|nr:oligosaccharide flippase family protein [Qipengyuania sphaerica]MBX7540821.1 oligosaccharide flippase family protein [Qipengyuania sphaerica]
MRARLDRLRQDPFVQAFFKAASLSMVLRLAWAVVNYAGVVLLARWLAPDDYGIYAFVMSAVMFLSVLCGMGAQTSLARFLGQYMGQGTPGLGRGAIHFFTWRVLTVSSIASALCIAGAFLAFYQGYIDDPRPYAVGALILPAFTVIDAQLGIARAYGAIFLALAPKDVLWRAALIPLALGVTMFIVPEFQLVTLLGGSALLITLAALGQRVALRRIMPDDFRDAEPEQDVAEWKSVAGPIWLTLVAGNLLNTIDTVTLGFFLQPSAVGLYYAASRTAVLVSFLLMVTSTVVGPQVSRHYHAAEYDKLRKLIKMSAVLIFVPSLFAFAVLAIFARQVLGLFGEEFVAMRWELIILAAGQAVNASVGCVRIVAVMTGHQLQSAWIQVPCSVLTSLAMVFGAWQYGSLGVAIATSLGISATAIALWIYVRRVTGFDPSILGIISQPRQR